MKMFKKKIILILVLVVIIILIGTLLYAKKGILNQKIFNNVKISQEQESNSNVNSVDISKWDLEKVNIVYDTNNVPVPVPKGYVASQVNGEHTVNSGFVIYEGDEPVIGLPNEKVGTYSADPNSAWVASCTRNQWVWVPVPDASRIYERDTVTGKAKSKLYEFTATGRTKYTNNNVEPGVDLMFDNEKNFSIYNVQGMSSEKLLQELENEFEETIKSIEKYGGFYVGRYETGDVGLYVSGSNHNTPRKFVIRRLNSDIGYSVWYDGYSNMKNIQVNDFVRTNMLFGCLWDEIMQWLVDTGSKTYEEIQNPWEWGNYKNTVFNYITKNGIEMSKNRDMILSTGSTERNKANNIYDMAGNVDEWTLESNYRQMRGGDWGYFGQRHSAAYRSRFQPTRYQGVVRCSCIFIYKIA